MLNRLIVLSLLVASPAAAAPTATIPPVVPAPETTLDTVENALPAAGGKVTLDDAVNRAIGHNPNTVIAQAEIARAIGIAREVRGTWFPTLNANGTYTHLDNDRVLSGRVIAAQDQLSANLLLTVPIVAPRQWVASDRAKENVANVRADGLDIRRQVAVATARFYLNVIKQERILDNARSAYATAKSHEDFAETRFKGGVGNRLDAARASQERATAGVALKTQLLAVASAQEALGVVIGTGSPVDAVAPPELGGLPSVQSAVHEAETRRADIIAQRDHVETAHNAVRDSWVDYLPLLSAVGQPFYQNPPTLTQPQTGWQAQLVLSLPLYDGGVRYGQHDQRNALEAEARAKLEGALRQARSDVRLAFEEVRRDDQAVASAQEAAKLARESLDLAELAYRTGATTNIEVIDAERRLHEVENDLAIAEDASRQARIDLLAASGRFPN